MHNILAREGVLEVGVGSHFRGFSIDLFQNAAILCHILCIHYKKNFLYSHGAGYRYFKDSSTVNWDLLCHEKAVAPSNKKIIIIRIWRFLTKVCTINNKS